MTRWLDALLGEIHCAMLGWHPRAIVERTPTHLRLRCMDCLWASPGIQIGPKRAEAVEVK